MANLIVQFLNGNGDAEIVRGTNNLEAKRLSEGPCPVINVPFATFHAPHVIPALSAALAGAGALTRIYLRGHGNWELTTVGGWNPRRVVTLLRLNGLTAARVISITGCNAARAPEVGEPERLTAIEDFHARKALADTQLSHTLNSFAGRFHRYLGSPDPFHAAIQTIPVTARMYSVSVNDAGAKKLAIGEVGREMKSGTGSARFGKVIYKWVNGAQHASWIFPDHDEY